MKAQVSMIKYVQKPRLLHVLFDNGEAFTFPSEFLQDNSESNNESCIKQTDNPTVDITSINPIGDDAVRLIFDNEPSCRIYSWEWLYELGKHYTKYNKKGRGIRTETNTAIREEPMLKD